MSEASEAPETAQGKQPTITPLRVVIALCLFAPFVAMLWVLISTALTMIAYKLWQLDQRARKGGDAR